MTTTTKEPESWVNKAQREAGGDARFGNFYTAGDVLRLLFNEEHASPYSSPHWTRNGSKILARAIVEHFHSQHIDELLQWLKETEKCPVLEGEHARDRDTNDHYWNRARLEVVKYVEEWRAKNPEKTPESTREPPPPVHPPIAAPLAAKVVEIASEIVPGFRRD